MVPYQTIREGIASAILTAFPSFPIDDEDSRHLDGPSFLVRLVDNTQELDDLHLIRREMDFTVVYLAPLNLSRAEITANGLKLATALQPTITFGEHVVMVDEVTTRLVDKDFQVDFTLMFYDELRPRERFDYMNMLDFKIELVKGDGK